MLASLLLGSFNYLIRHAEGHRHSRMLKDAVQSVSEEMNANDQDWDKNKGDTRPDGSPQDKMKAKLRRDE